MMAVVIAEPLLPVFPAQAVLAGLVEGESGGQVYVRGDLVYAWDDPRADGELIIRLDPMPTARETAAVAELCEHLTAAEITFPGTDRLRRYQIKNSR